jgi:hypothetical protein
MVIPLILLLIICWGFLPAGAAGLQENVNFTDLNEHWASTHIIRITALDIIEGYPDHTFKPDQDISRLECLALLLRAGGFAAETERLSSRKGVSGKTLPPPNTPSASSSATPQVPWGQHYVDLAADKGFLPFVSGSDYDYSAPISRLETAKLVVHIMYMRPPVFESDPKPVDKDSPIGAGFAKDEIFSDESLVPPCDQSYIRAVTAAGVMSGYPDGTFRPFDFISRAESAVVLSQLLDRGWVKTASGRSFTGWISRIDTQKGHNELEITSFGNMQKFKIAQDVKCYMAGLELPIEQAVDYLGEVILDASRQVSWINLVEQRESMQNKEKIRGSVKLVGLGRDNFIVLCDLNCEDHILMLAWDSAVYGKKTIKSFASLKPGTFVDVETTMDQARVATVLDVKTITGQVEKLSAGRLYLKGGLSGNKPGWFNNYDYARMVNKDGIGIDSVLAGDKVQVTYIDPYPEEIDDELPLEIKLQ